MFDYSKKDLTILGRARELFTDDILHWESELYDAISGSKCLVIGAAGTIGQAVCFELLQRNPSVVHAVDISENNLVEFVRRFRSSVGYNNTDLRTFAIDCGSDAFAALVKNNLPYDFVFNLSALKHVRNEKDPYTLIRMIDVNIINTLKIIDLVRSNSLKKYFCVSTDKATNPVNMMGASKRIMELFAIKQSEEVPISLARFANVAFSDGSLLHGFEQRLLLKQPISAPVDVLRYFLTKKEAGQLCVMSAVLGDNREVLFPKECNDFKLKGFSELARSYLISNGFDPVECTSEQEARQAAAHLIPKQKWPCYFFKSDTTGEKSFEEFYAEDDQLNLTAFRTVGKIRMHQRHDRTALDGFLKDIQEFRNSNIWNKADLVKIFKKLIPEFQHTELNRNLDQRM